ncbi:MAG: hypothetical protein K8R31_02580 [Bacteroidales bacterium]|nr:hypothetical protein [Bacteroidales bacterium]
MKRVLIILLLANLILYTKSYGSELIDSHENINKIQHSLAKEQVANNYTYYEKHFSLGAGFGRSYGGIGVRAQWRLGEDFAFAPHLGLGYTPNNIGFPIFLNAGLKMYFYKPVYIDLQFGVFGENSQYIDDYIDEWPAWGPSFLAGADINLGEMFGINFGGGISLDIGGTEIFPAFDLGFFIRF